MMTVYVFLVWLNFEKYFLINKNFKTILRAVRSECSTPGSSMFINNSKTFTVTNGLIMNLLFDVRTYDKRTRKNASTLREKVIATKNKNAFQ